MKKITIEALKTLFCGLIGILCALLFAHALKLDNDELQQGQKSPLTGWTGQEKPCPVDQTRHGHLAR
jgi:hypothetical protein